MATVWDHLSVEELEERFVGCEDASASRHFQVIWLLARGHTVSQVSGTTAYGERWIEQLLARYNAEGPEALGDLRRRNGAPATILKPDLLAKLRLRLDDPPPDGGLWSPLGERPIAHGHHRFDWLYVTAFVSPATGETFWYVSNGVSKEFFEALLETFAREAEAGLSRIILLVLDNAGWHGPANLKIPDGVRLIYLPPYSPELQPAETLWALVDEPIVNQHIATITDLDEKIAAQCIALSEQREQIQSRTGFHWWPKRIAPN